MQVHIFQLLLYTKTYPKNYYIVEPGFEICDLPSIGYLMISTPTDFLTITRVIVKLIYSLKATNKFRKLDLQMSFKTNPLRSTDCVKFTMEVIQGNFSIDKSFT